MRERMSPIGAGRLSGSGLHKGAILQHPGPGRVFKDLGVAQRYCTTDSIGNTFMHMQISDWIGYPALSRRVLTIMERIWAAEGRIPKPDRSV